MSTLSPAQVTAARATINALKEELGLSPDDALLLQSTIEGESDVFATWDAILEESIRDTTYLDRLDERRSRIAARIARHKEWLHLLAQDLGLSSIKRDHGSVSISAGRESVELIGDVPEEFTSRAPDKTRIANALKAGLRCNWARLKRGADIVTVRSK